jgi:hypothetical protein
VIENLRVSPMKRRSLSNDHKTNFVPAELIKVCDVIDDRSLSLSSSWKSAFTHTMFPFKTTVSNSHYANKMTHYSSNTLNIDSLFNGPLLSDEQNFALPCGGHCWSCSCSHNEPVSQSSCGDGHSDSHHDIIMDNIYYNETLLPDAPLFKSMEYKLFDGEGVSCDKSPLEDTDPLPITAFADYVSTEEQSSMLCRAMLPTITNAEGSSVVSAESDYSSSPLLETSFAGDFFQVRSSTEDSLSDHSSVSSSASIESLNPFPLHTSLPHEIQFEAPDAVPTEAESSIKEVVVEPTPVSSNDLPAFKLLNKVPTTESKDCDGVDPNDIDVLCGKGGRTLLHNRHFTQLCSRYATQYSETKKRGSNGKRGIALTIVREVQGNNGRFLKPQDTGSGWEVISDELAMNKVAHCIRDLIRRLKNEKVR